MSLSAAPSKKKRRTTKQKPNAYNAFTKLKLQELKRRGINEMGNGEGLRIVSQEWADLSQQQKIEFKKQFESDGPLKLPVPSKPSPVEHTPE